MASPFSQIWKFGIYKTLLLCKWTVKTPQFFNFIKKKCFFKRPFNNNNLLYLYSAFLGTQNTLHRRGKSPQPPPMCSIHLDDATAAIVCQSTHHTPAYWWRGDRVMKAYQCIGMIRRPWWSEANGGIWGFLVTTKSQDLGLTSFRRMMLLDSIVSPSLGR